MPANVRQKYKAKLDSAVNNLDNAIGHMAEIAEEFKEHHPEVTEVMELGAAGILQIQELIQTIRDMI